MLNATCFSPKTRNGVFVATLANVDGPKYSYIFYKRLVHFANVSARLEANWYNTHTKQVSFFLYLHLAFLWTHFFFSCLTTTSMAHSLWRLSDTNSTDKHSSMRIAHNITRRTLDRPWHIESLSKWTKKNLNQILCFTRPSNWNNKQHVEKYRDQRMWHSFNIYDRSFCVNNYE